MAVLSFEVGSKCGMKTTECDGIKTAQLSGVLLSFAMAKCFAGVV